MDPFAEPSGIAEFIAALKGSPRMGNQVVHHQILPATERAVAATRRPWSRPLQRILEARGIEELYAHQARACDLVRAGRHVVVATPTASGKTMAYNLPVLEQLVANPDARALYLFPLKALARDQLKAFHDLAAEIPEERRPTAAVYDGDTKPHARTKLRKNPPNVLFTNPEMLHLSMLPHHDAWSVFWAGLTHVVVDETHTYRGVMGSHMAHVFRRLRRMCSYYGSDPAFVFSSATIGNPAELATDLTGLEAQVVSESGAPQGKRHFVFLNPHDSPATAAINLLKAALPRGLRTIVYAQSRRMTELISMWAQDKAGDYKDRISAYRAGFLPEERREVEQKLSSGELLAVISTSALELGIDIGGLDLCILVGYPGTIMQTLQRGGRVGRQQQDAAVVLVAGEDALDQYFMRYPQELFSRPAESAVLNPANPVIAGRHLVCAASELTLRPGEPYLDDACVAETVQHCLDEGRLFVTADGEEYVSPRKRPHREIDLRGAGDTFVIQTVGDEQVVGQIDESRAFRETHDGAVYLHRGTTYVVEKLDLGARTVHVAPRRVGYYTKVRGQKETEILETYATKEVFGTRVSVGKLKVTEQVTAYEKRAVSGGKLLAIVPLDLPSLTFETEGIWIEVPAAVKRAAEDEYFHFMGGIHAVEHAAIGILPLLVMTDRNDLGGISIPHHEQVGAAAVFVYDGAPGGVGLSRLAYDKADELLSTTLATMRDCECDLGCPSCVHSPKCGSGNRPIAKDAAIFVMERIMREQPSTKCITIEQPPQETEGAQAEAIRYGVLDIETRRSAQEVGGWNKADRMGVSVAVLYDSVDDSYYEYEQDAIPDLLTKMQGLDTVIGFNVRRFDYAVLSGVHGFDWWSLPTLDMLEVVHGRLGYRLSLDHLATHTLGAKKTADGLLALEWWKAGEIAKIAEYCRADVCITNDLYMHGRDKGFLLFRNKAKKLVRLPVEW